METQILLNEMLEKYKVLPWEAIEGTISVLQFFMVYIPAIVVFLFYKLSLINVWVKETTCNGSEFILHNKTKQTIRVSEIKLKFEKEFFDKIPEVCDDSSFILKADECVNIRISYKKNIQEETKLKIIVYHSKIQRKIIKVKI